MNFKSIFTVFLILGTNLLNAQWVIQNPEIQAERINDIVTADSVTSYCAGHFGRIMKSTDKGDTWKVLNTGVNDLFIKIFFIDSKTGWALTYDSNKLYRTVDNGSSWTLISEIDSNKMINDLVFINDTTGFITGDFNSIIRTDDGGKTWTTLNITNTTWSGTSSIFFLNESTGFVVLNSSLIFKTINGGGTWEKINRDPSYRIIEKIFCIDTYYLFASGFGDHLNSIYYFLEISNDGGRNWKTIYFDKPIRNIYFIDPMVGTIIKEDKVLVTTDGGASWKETQISAYRFSFFNDNKTALAIAGSNLVKKTTDFWNSSRNVTQSITSSNLNSVSPLDSMNVVACGNNETIVITNDGGKLWQKVHNSGTNELNDILYINRQEILACGAGIILSSTNGGRTWNRDSLNATWINDLEYVNDSLIFAAGFNKEIAVLFFSQNKGRSWNSYTNFPLTGPIDKIKFSNNHLGWITSNKDIYKTTDNGLNWNIIPGMGICYGAVDAKGDSAWFSKMNNVLITTDAGKSWNQYKMFDYQKTIFSTYCISMKNSKEGSVGLYDGRILDTYDGGKSWEDKFHLTSTPIYDLKYINGNYGWAVGNMGLIMKYSTTKTEIEDNNLRLIPEDFYLGQNYPNPFNPETTISYSIPKSEHVKLKIYDMLGREVATLVDEYKNAGTYHSTFNTLHSSLSSGVYFYRLQAGTFSETKKLILMK